MAINFKYSNGEVCAIKAGYNYFYPLDATIEISGCDYIEINGRERVLESGKIIIKFSGDDLDLTCAGKQYFIRSYGNLPDDDVRFEYKNFDLELQKFLSYQDGESQSKKIYDSFLGQGNITSPSLCTFGRNVSSLRDDKSLGLIAEHMKNLRQVFTRPKSHLREEMEVLPVEVVSRISHETIQHLACHSEDCEARRAGGVVPSRLLAKALEEDYGIYENIVAKNLVDRVYSYIKTFQHNVNVAQVGETFSLAVSHEHSSVYKAQKFLYQGFGTGLETEDNDTSFLAERSAQCEEILSTVIFCRESDLYRKLKKCKKTFSPIKQTNIFMMDPKYSSVYKLWRIMDLLGLSGEQLEVGKDERKAYFNYVSTLIHFALSNSNFVPKEDILAENGSYIACEYLFDHWVCKYEPFRECINGIPGVCLRFSMKGVYSISINLQDAHRVHHNFVESFPDRIEFSLKPTDAQIEGFLKELYPSQQRVDKATSQKRNDVKSKIVEFFNNCDSFTKSVLFVPLMVNVKPLEVDFDMVFKELSSRIEAFVEDNAIDYVYFVIPERPSDDEDISRKDWSKKMIKYTDMIGKERFGCIPITIGDIDSYRRLTKVFLGQMVLVDKNHKYCPICGSELSQNNNGEYFCSNCEPGFTLRHIRCQKCGKYYLSSNYQLPLSFTAHSQENKLGNRFEIQEIGAGFKNITDVDEQFNPICPYC